MFEMNRETAESMCELIGTLIDLRAGNNPSGEVKDALWALAGDVRHKLPGILCPQDLPKRKKAPAAK